VAPTRNVFLGKNVADPIIKKSKIISANLKYQLKNKYPPLAKNFAKEYCSVVTHVLYLQFPAVQFPVVLHAF
jgi:hypothetical protein